MASNELGDSNSQEWSDRRSGFNLEALKDDQIVILGRLIIGGLEMVNAGKLAPDEDVVRDKIHMEYIGALGAFFGRHRERGRAVIARMVRSEEDYDKYNAALSAPTLALHDFNFAIDVIIGINNSAGAISIEALQDCIEAVEEIMPERSHEMTRRINDSYHRDPPFFPPSLAVV